MTDITLVVTVSRTSFLEQSFSSIGAQYFKNFWLIIVVDESKIDSNLVRNFYFKYCAHPIERTKILGMIGNNSAGLIRNRGFSSAETKWIAYMDDDDIITPNAMQAVSEFLPKAEQNDIGFFSSGIFTIDKQQKITMIQESLNWRPSRQIYFGNPEYINKPTYFNQFQVIRKKQWEKYPFKEEMGEDLDYVMHHLLMCKFIKLPMFLYGYRETENSFSRSKQIDIFTKRYQNGYYYSLLKKNESIYSDQNLL